MTDPNTPSQRPNQPAAPSGFPAPSATPPPGPSAPAWGAPAGAAPPNGPSVPVDLGAPPMAASGPGRRSSKLLAVVAAVVVLGIVAAVVLRRGGSSDEATWRFGGQPVDAPASEPSRAWSASLDGTVMDTAGGDGWVFVSSDTGDGDGSILVTAFDSEGAEQWAEEVDRFAGGVRLDGGLLFVSQQGESTETEALDPKTGRSLWSSDASPSHRLPGGHFIGYAYDGEAHTVRLDGDGDTVWEVDGYPSDVCGDRVFVTDAEELMAYDLGTGKRAWPRAVDASGVACSGSTVFVTHDGEVTALDAGSGDERWSERVADAGGVTAVRDLVLVSSGGDRMVARSAFDGAKRWSAKGSLAGPVSVGDELVAIGDGSRTRLVDVGSGDERFRSDRGESLVRATRGWLASDGSNGGLRLIADGSFDEQWSKSFGSYPTVEDGMVIVSDEDDVTVYR